MAAAEETSMRRRVTAFLLAFIYVPPVYGGIDLKMPSQVRAGQDIIADATLIGYGAPFAGARLYFVLDGSETRTEATDDTGTAHLKLRGIIPAGTHQIDVYY